MIFQLLLPHAAEYLFVTFSHLHENSMNVVIVTSYNQIFFPSIVTKEYWKRMMINIGNTYTHTVIISRGIMSELATDSPKTNKIYLSIQ